MLERQNKVKFNNELLNERDIAKCDDDIINITKMLDNVLVLRQAK